MSRFKISRNNNQEQKLLLQAKLDASLVEDVNLLSKWSGNEKNYVIAELLRYALSQESDFQAYKQTLTKQPATAGAAAVSEPMRKDIASERKTPSQLPVAK